MISFSIRYFLIIIGFTFNLSAIAQNFEGTLSIQSEYISAEKNAVPSKSNFVLILKNNKALIEQKNFGKIILHASQKEIYAIVGKGNQPTVWKVNLNTLNELGGLMALLKSVTGQDIINIQQNTKLTAGTSTQTLAGYKAKKYQTDNETYTGTAWVADNFAYDFSGVWDLFNIKKPLEDAHIKNGMILKATSKNKKTGESSTLILTPKKESIDSKIFDIPSAAQILDITPMLIQMLQSQKPEEVQKMLLQMLPKNK